MIYWIIGIIAFLLWLAFVIEEGFGVIEGICIGFITMIVTSLFTLFIFIGVGAASSLIFDSTMHKVKDQKVIALQDGRSTSGEFFLGTGSVDSKIKYTYMTVEENEMEMKQIDYDDAVLIYSPHPKVEVYKAHYKNKIVKFFFGDQPFLSNTKYKIYVPEGTVKESYNVDLE